MSGPRSVEVLAECSLSSRRAHLDSCGKSEMWGKVEDGKHFPVTVMELHLWPLEQVGESGVVVQACGLPGDHLTFRSRELGSAEGNSVLALREQSSFLKRSEI